MRKFATMWGQAFRPAATLLGGVRPHLRASSLTDVGFARELQPHDIDNWVELLQHGVAGRKDFLTLNRIKFLRSEFRQVFTLLIRPRPKRKTKGAISLEFALQFPATERDKVAADIRTPADHLKRPAIAAFQFLQRDASRDPAGCMPA